MTDIQFTCDHVSYPSLDLLNNKQRLCKTVCSKSCFQQRYLRTGRPPDDASWISKGSVSATAQMSAAEFLVGTSWTPFVSLISCTLIGLAGAGKQLLGEVDASFFPSSPVCVCYRASPESSVLPHLPAVFISTPGCHQLVSRVTTWGLSSPGCQACGCI